MAKKKKLFKKVRGSYLPISRQGWLNYIPYLLFLVGIYIYSMIILGYTLVSYLFIILNWILAGAIMTWYASQHSA